jgi:hypothetical protein
VDLVFLFLAKSIFFIPLLTGRIVVVHFRRGCELDATNNPVKLFNAAKCGIGGCVGIGYSVELGIGLGACILGFMRFSEFGFRAWRFFGVGFGCDCEDERTVWVGIGWEL